MDDSSVEGWFAPGLGEVRTSSSWFVEDFRFQTAVPGKIRRPPGVFLAERHVPPGAFLAERREPPGPRVDRSKLLHVRSNSIAIRVNGAQMLQPAGRLTPRRYMMENQSVALTRFVNGAGHVNDHARPKVTAAVRTTPAMRNSLPIAIIGKRIFARGTSQRGMAVTFSTSWPPSASDRVDWRTLAGHAP